MPLFVPGLVLTVTRTTTKTADNIVSGRTVKIAPFVRKNVRTSQVRLALAA